MAQMYEASFRNIEEGAVVRGRVVKVTLEGVMIDIGYKSEGIVPIDQFQREELERLLPGAEVEIFIEDREDSEGNVLLSKEKAEKIKVWESIARASEQGDVVEGRVVSRIKGGLTVDLGGVKAFLPGSQIDLRPVRNFDQLIGQTFQMRILKMNARRGNIVLSRRVLLEEERNKRKEQTLGTLKEGQVVRGAVKNLTEYGAFIDLGGIDGLLHITDMSWGRIGHPSEIFSVGDKVEVVVLKYDREHEKVSLGYKQRLPDPWSQVAGKYPVGKRLRGKVVSLAEYGAFVELEPGIEGLVHVSEMSWTHKVRHPSKLVSVGDLVDAVVLNVDPNNKRISLGMKQAEPNPWDTIARRYPVGTRVEGKVRNITEFGAFIGIEEGIDGLVHISDLSWTRHIKHPSEVLKKGQKVDAVVLHVDPEKERISLGIKQATGDPWESLIPETYTVGKSVQGKVVRQTEHGVFVELAEGVEGLIYASELGRDEGGKTAGLNVGDEITAEIIKVDTAERKIGLSMRARQRSTEREATGEYNQGQQSLSTTLGSLLREKGI
ncbi:MAG: 30S ribosomal protein S1 [Nitrospirae bacterium RBG_16_64_22]|nr:MAG: 30S ribosomal protein S1 [Nitrospirae bacterium RBG_16_64_22]